MHLGTFHDTLFHLRGGEMEQDIFPDSGFPPALIFYTQELTFLQKIHNIANK